MSQNTLIVPHKRRDTVWYILHAPILALRAICFKFHDRLKQRSIDFQNVTPETVQNDKRFYAYRYSVVLSPIISSTRSTQGADTRMHAWPMRQRISKSKGLLIDVLLCFYFQHVHRHVQKVRGSRSTLQTTSTTFSTHHFAQKVRGSTDMCSKFST
jgi:hypothetical protein